MLGVIINEKSIIDNILNNKSCNINIYNAISLLIKHYYLKELEDKIKIKETIINDLSNCGDIEFKRVEWEDNISKLIDKFFKTVRIHKDLKVKLVEIDKISITINEINKINELPNKKLRKLAFTLLAYAKISNISLDSEKGWINQSFKNIFTESKVSAKGNDKKLLLHDLYKLDYISQSYKGDNTSLKINYVDNDIDSEIAFEITDFDFVIYSYLIYIGEHWKKCEGCNKRYFIKSNNKQKYCNACKKDIKNNQNKTYYKNLGK